MSTSPQAIPDFNDLLNRTRHLALKLELRDEYLVTDPAYLAWQRGDHDETYRLYTPWTDIVRETVARGVDMRRVRVVSEPVSVYIRFEHAVTQKVNIDGGERIRWIGRGDVADLLLPPVDLWVLDDVALVYLFGADGESAGARLIDDAAVVAGARDAIEAAWERATEHASYDPS